MKVYLAYKVELDFSACYYEGDIPSVSKEFRVFKTKRLAEDFIENQKSCYWEIEELELT
jgi:hypothetical protein